MQHTPPPLQIAKPCPKHWDELHGDDRKRFCDACQLHVHNLSAMPERERSEFVAQSGGRLCIAYVQRPDGSMVTPSPWDFSRRIFTPVRWAVASVLAVLLPAAFPGCASRSATLGKAAPACDTHQQKNARVGDGGGMTLGMPMPPESKANSQPRAAN